MNGERFTPPADAKKVFERKNSGWHIEVYRNPDGTATINRIKGILLKPLCWQSKRTPEDWLSIQEDAEEYRPY